MPQGLAQVGEAALSSMAHGVRQYQRMSLHLGYNQGLDSIFFLDVKVVEGIVLARSEIHSAPANATAAGKMLLALLPQAQLDNLLVGPLDAMCDGTITDPDQLRADLRKTADAGLAVNSGETAERGYSIAAPIYNRFGEPIAAIAAALLYWSGDDATSHEFRQAVRPLVIDIAARVSRLMGHSDDSRTVVA